jgi:hypothetical protein
VEEEALDEDDLFNIQITKIEGQRKVEGPYMESKVFFHQSNLRKSTLGQMTILKW